MGYQLQFYGAILKIVLNSTLVAGGYLLGGFPLLDTNYYDSNNNFFLVNAFSNVDVNTWLAILGHVGQERMNRLVRESLLGSLANIDLPICKSCLAGKATRKPFGKATRAESPL